MAIFRFSFSNLSSSILPISLLMTLLLLSICAIQAQNEQINGRIFNQKKLTQKTLKEINNIRLGFNIPTLSWETDLAKRARKIHRIRQRKLSKSRMLRKIDHQLVQLYAHYDPVTVQFLDLDYKPSYGPTFTYDLAAKEAVRNWYSDLQARPALVSSKFGTAFLTIEIDRKAGILRFTLLLASPDLKNPLGKKNAKDAFDLKNGLLKNRKACQRCDGWLGRLPREVSFNVQNDGDSLFLYFSHPQYLNDLLLNKADGFAVDIVSKSQFSCQHVNLLDPHWAYDGYLTQPKFFPDFLTQQQIPKDNKALLLNLGPLPKDLPPGPKEFNLLIVQKGVACTYNQFLPIESYRWRLLETPLLMDTTALSQSNDSLLRGLVMKKEITYTVPFSKNKSAFHPADFKDLYQKLNLIDYQITRIDIKAYSSIEGTRKENLELQQQRAQSMVRALEAYQNDSIRRSIETYENWVEFYEDISQSIYKDMVYKSKPEIKKLLNEEGYYQRLEPYLKKHRKAICNIHLEKREKSKQLSQKQVIQLFENYIQKDQMELLVALQQKVFHDITEGQLSSQIMDQLPLPEKVKYGALLNNRKVFQARQFAKRIHKNKLKEVNKEFLPLFRSLHKLDQKNPYILFNLLTLELENWAKQGTDQMASKPFFNRSEMEKHIHYLQDTLPSKITQSLSINYHIVLAEFLMKENQFDKKDRVIRQVAKKYLNKKLQPNNALYLAQYLNSYHMYHEAFQILHSYVVSLNASEDLLFYFLNMALTREEWRERAIFRAALTNAANTNKKRFCLMIQGQSGSFQLLRFEELKNTYCEYCN